MLFVCSLRSLPSSQLICCPATPTLLPQTWRRCWINFKLRRAVSLTTNDMEKSSSAGICNHDWLAIGWRLQSQFNAQVYTDRRLSGTRTGVRVAESCAKRPTASRWWTRRSLKWCMSKLGKFSLQVTMVLWTLFRMRLKKKHLFQRKSPNRACVKFWLYSQASVPRQLYGASILCLRKQGQPSPGFVWEWWAERRSVCQPRDNLRPCCKANSRIFWSCRFKGSVEWSRHERHFCSLLPYFLLSWLKIFQLCLSFWTSSFDMVLFKKFLQEKEKYPKNHPKRLSS